MGLGDFMLMILFMMALGAAIPVTVFFCVKFSVYAYYCGLELYEHRKARELRRENENDGRY